MITLYQFMRIVEIRTKIISVSAFLLGALYGIYRFGSVDILVLVTMGAAVLAVDMATTGFNSFFDYFHGVDHRKLNREEDKVLVHEGVPAGTALIVSLILYLAAAVLGVILAFIATPWVIPIGAVSMLVGYLYTGGPRPISRTPLGELFAGGFLGWLLVSLTIFVLAPEEITGRDLLVGIPSFLFVASILTVNNTCDIEGDTRSGRRTLSILLGRPAGELLVYLQGAAAFIVAGALAGTGVLPRQVLFGIVTAAVLSVPVYLGMHRRGYSHETKGPSMGAISRIFLLYSLGILVPLAIVIV
ncbi:MAG: prenyltransferase [Alkalispirochaeta sp.]